MAVTNNAVIRAALGYVEANPAELDTVRDLVLLALDGPPVVSPRTLPAHVACRAAVATPDWRVLQVRTHPGGPWRLPGGHVADRDASLLGSALRQLTNVAGIDPNVVRLDSASPSDLAVVAEEQPELPGAPEHVHYEFRYLLHVSSDETDLPPGAAARWVPAADIPGTLGTKLRLVRTAPAHRPAAASASAR